jgi:hypothetical protein
MPFWRADIWHALHTVVLDSQRFAEALRLTAHCQITCRWGTAQGTFRRNIRDGALGFERWDHCRDLTFDYF